MAFVHFSAVQPEWRGENTLAHASGIGLAN
jgi:hypothetical protein